MLRYRVLSAVVLVPVVFAVIWFGDPWFTLALGVVALLGVLEFYQMLASAGKPPLVVFGSLWTILFIAGAHCPSPHVLPLLFAGAVILPLMWLVTRPDVEKGLERWLGTLGGILYVGWLLSYFVPLWNIGQGRDWVLLVVFATFATDTTAYFVGRWRGRHPLAPAISPKKSIEGAVAGFLGGVTATVVLAIILRLDGNLWQTVLLGCLIGVVSQVGDLAESLLKRSTGVKDASHLIPGHGGVLDRLDSLLFTVVVVYYYVIWVIS